MRDFRRLGFIPLLVLALSCGSAGTGGPLGDSGLPPVGDSGTDPGAADVPVVAEATLDVPVLAEAFEDAAEDVQGEVAVAEDVPAPIDVPLVEDVPAPIDVPLVEDVPVPVDVPLSVDSATGDPGMPPPDAAAEVTPDAGEDGWTGDPCHPSVNPACMPGACLLSDGTTGACAIGDDGTCFCAAEPPQPGPCDFEVNAKCEAALCDDGIADTVDDACRWYADSKGTEVCACRGVPADPCGTFANPECKPGACTRTDGTKGVCATDSDGGCVCQSETPPECVGDAACIGKAWLVKCHGHWDCLSGACVERCGDPCGNGVCDTYTGEDGMTCPEDCAATPCVLDSECSDDSYCARPAIGCDVPGICQARPIACPVVWDPICGCDGKTWPSACDAASSGMSVMFLGTCDDVPCKTSADCPKSGFCDVAVGDCSGEGVCAPRPLMCPKIYAPVCGCNGVTYDNDCFADLAGVAVAFAGECPGTECVADADCLARDWLVDCSGHWDCSMGWCVPACGEPCGDGTCDPKAGESVGTCAQDCSTPTKCLSNLDCSKSDYCEKALGDCDGSGACADRPEVCPKLYAPVCGCDGLTYDNACFAAASGLNVLHDGACKVPECATDFDCIGGVWDIKCYGSWDCLDGTCSAVCGKPCGDGICDPKAGEEVANCNDCVPALGCKDSSVCEATDYCAKAVGDCIGAGTCMARPDSCSDVWDPVCGCDGMTYPSSCDAAAAGTSVLHVGECLVPSCATNLDCSKSAYCQKAVGDCDGSGTCADRPGACPLAYIPVCGCDGLTYDNACTAAASGMNVLHDGACPAKCLTNLDCSKSDFCNKTIGDCKGPGSCLVRPSGCSTIFKPVCACNGQTYANECDANRLGLSIAYEGLCKSL